ncbi:MAG: hypothetical protein QOD75_3537 [Blastocatellia bacterium]|jgi:NAD-dependent SIR2 family protein deacetylase|nr:hypothetical protein [Blastocatellia bacterium]
MPELTPDAPAGERAADLITKAGELRKQAEALEKQARDLLAPSEARAAAQRIVAGKERVAVFLGAGASFTFGFPLTKELLPIIIRRLIAEPSLLFEDRRANKEADNKEDRELLKKALRALCPGMQFTGDFVEKNKSRLPLVTSLLSMLDYSLSAGQALVARLTPEEITKARTLLERAIYEAIEFGDSPIGQFSRSPKPTTLALTRWVDGLRALGDVCVITSNYDTAVEKAWGFEDDDQFVIERLAPDFGFDWLWPTNSYEEQVMRRPAQPLHRLYKLHGSTNWLRCGLCDRIYINPLVDIAIYAYERRQTLNNQCHCGHGKLEVEIVSPSFVREMRAPNLISIWQQALSWLRTAEDWIVVGYSFPDEDLNIRSLFTRALASRREGPPNVTAIQFGGDEQTRMRYEAFFPNGKLTFLTGGLDAFLQSVAAG